ncbi:MAG: DUF362 domain-containing protein [Sedimentisphaerales bacterium]|nr:DUF362 domain-containing protein [Sedimentisphaerales bacterium]
MWFLIRVIPKPSRAAYPCQRAAFPLASAFVVWLTGIVVSSLAYRKAKRLMGRSRYVAAGFFAVVAVGAIWWSFSITADTRALAAFVPSDPPNSPIGVGKGIHPGRVVWIHDPSAATWDGVTGYWWEDRNLNPQVVDDMVSRSLRALTGQWDDTAAWDAIFRYFNRTHGAGDVGYQPGEKIAIKINLNEEGYGPAYGGNGRMPSPQMIQSLLAQLFNNAGVSGSNVTIYDASRAIADPLYNRIHGDADPDFQNVRFVANTTSNGRIGAVYDPASPVHFANPSVSPVNNATAYLPTCVTEAKYLIDLALFSGHSMYGFTASGKNWFGSICWRTNANYFPWNGGWTPSPLHNFGLRNNAMGTYNPIVDLIGHPQLGGKTLLYLVDGLYGSDNAITPVLRFNSFGNNWTASVFASQDSIAIDSVMLDFLRNEPLLNNNCSGQGVDNYLHEAAQANNPPSGSFYDPASTGSRLASLGVHEHWNNATDKQYSRNLDPVNGTGIELVTGSGFYADLADLLNLAAHWLMQGCSDTPACNGADLNGDRNIDLNDFVVLANRWLVDETIQLHLKLDETNGTTAYDNSVYSRPGTLTNGPVWSAGHAGGALSFDGTNDYVQIAGYKGIIGSASRTCCAWIKPLAVTGEILGWGTNTTGARWVIRVNENGTLRAEVSGGNIYGTTLLTDGNWHHVAVVLENDGSTDISEARLYVDGILETTGGAVPCLVNTSLSEDVRIGVHYSLMRYYNGMIDDVWIYRRALTSTEIADLAK